jgi:biotin carboxyl carrier protein
LVGLLKQEASALDLEYAFQQVGRAATKRAEAQGKPVVDATRKVLELKETLLERPLARLVDEPHYLSAWLSQQQKSFSFAGERVVWHKNPVEVLCETYHLLNMTELPDTAAANVIWTHDREQLNAATGFYRKLKDRAPELADFRKLSALLSNVKPQLGFSESEWLKVRGAHAGFQLGLEMLSVLPLIAKKVGFYELKVVPEDMTIHIPQRLLESELQAAMKKVLVPPPVMKSDEIAAISGGMFYGQEAPGMPLFISKGAHFNKGDALYVVEVMKMFNKVLAPFAGTVDEILVEGNGTIVQKGQILFKVTPDEKVVVEDPKEREKRIRATTDGYVAGVC